MKIKFLTLIAISFLFLNCQGQQSKNIQTVDVKSFAEKLKSNKMDIKQIQELIISQFHNLKIKIYFFFLLHSAMVQLL